MTTTRQPRQPLQPHQPSQPPTTAHIQYAQQQQQSTPPPADATVIMDLQNSAHIDPQSSSPVAPATANMPAASPSFSASQSDPEDAFQPNIKGYQEFLISKLEYLSDDARRSLTGNLDKRGWPPHLREMETANWQLVPTMPWELADKDALMLLSASGVKVKDIADIFFEGRTAHECQNALDNLRTHGSIIPVEDNEEPAPSSARSSNTMLSSPAQHDTAPRTPPSETSITSPPKKEVTEISPETCAESSRGRPRTSHADSQKPWEQADRKVIWEVMKKNLTARQIQQEYLPSRSESAIQTRICKERKLRSAQSTQNESPERNSDGEADAPGCRDMQIVDENDDDSDYVEDSSPREKPSAAKASTTSSNSTPTKKVPSISVIRTKLLNSIDNHVLSKEKKSELKKALRNKWPSHFVSVESHNAPPARGTRWSDNDVTALRIIHETAPNLPYRFVAYFFPGRNESGISRQMNQKIKSTK